MLTFPSTEEAPQNKEAEAKKPEDTPESTQTGAVVEDITWI